MSTLNEQQAAEQLLSGYAEVLNAANTALIPSFYTHDGAFMPDGFKTLTKKDLDNAGGKYLKNTGFKIKYAIISVTITPEYTFIDATAQTTAVSVGKKEEANLSSRDFFVLRKEGSDWKIFRYLFNRTQN
ncbi:MAG: hypothetical protein EOP41_00990 [Sphingobacteriaceae bacterium]|nr:MAG: hypothetical protein EOP41_00990 [Sphingobacteriaceae bacterium]